MMRKILSMLLALTMILSLFSGINVFAAEASAGPDGVLVTLIKDGKSVAGGDFSGPKIGWGTKIIDNTSAEWADFVKAVNNKDAKFVLKYTVTGEVANEEYGWWNILHVDTPKGGLGHITIANHSGEAAKFVDTLDGKVMSNQWSLLHIGEHVVTYSTADFANLLATHECTTKDEKEPDNPDKNFTHVAGDTAVEKITALFSQSGLADTLSVSVSSLVIEGPSGTTEPDPEPEGVLVTLIKDSKSVEGVSFAGPSVGWRSKVITSSNSKWSDYLKAVKTPDAKFVLKYTIDGEAGKNKEGKDATGYINFFQTGVTTDAPDHIGFANYSGDASMLKDNVDGEDKPNQWSLVDKGTHIVTLSCADYVDFISKHTCSDHEAGSVTIDDTAVLVFQADMNNGAEEATPGTRTINVTDLYIEGPTGTTEPEDKPDTNTSILLDIGPNVWALSKSEAIDISKSGTYTLKATAGTMDGNSDDTFIGLKSDKEDKSTELPDGTTITLKSVKLGDTAVTVTKGEETYTVKDGKLDFVLKLIAFDTNTNIFEGTLPSEFTTVEVTFVVNNPDDPLEPEVHEHTFDETKWEHDDTTHWHECTAKDCDKSEGYKTEPEEHTLDYVVNKEDATKHDVTCTVCGAVIETVAHTYKDGVCTLCKAEHDHTGEEIKYTDNENGTHKVEYTVCKLVKEAEDCTYDATTGKCTKCGAAKPAEEEECDHVGTERTYKVNEKDATKHDVICAKCKTVIETVAHTYENGVCTACEAKHDHTDEKITYVDKKDGTHTATYADCGLVETAKHTYKDGVCTLCESEHDHADEKVSYVDNKDGTHTATYADCGLTVEEKCTYDEKTGKCVCGAEKKVEVSTECTEEHKGWTIVDVSSYKDMDGNFYIDLPKTGKTGDLMSIHIIGTVTGTDAPRIFIANNGEWDNNFTGSYDHRLTVTDGVINYSADSFVLTAPKSGGDVASRIAFRDVKGLTITHLAYLFVDPTEEDPDAPTVPECTQDHEGWKIVDVTTYKNKSGEFNIPITGNVKAGDTLTVHIIGYATTAGRFYVANDEGSDHDLSGGRANVIDEKVKLDANGVFDYTTEPFTLYAPKSGSIVATRFIFKDSKALTITHFAYLVEHPESEPKGYEEDETLTNATVEAEDDSVVITPDGELKTEGLLVTFDGEGAPAAGKVTVTLAGGTTVKFDYEKVDALSVEKFAPDRVENGVITFNAVWGDCPGLWIGDNSTVTGYDSLQLKIDSVSDYSQFQIAYTDGSDNTVQGFANAGTYNIAIDPTKTIKQVFVQSSAAGGTVAISNILLRKAPVEEATKIEVSFKAGKKYVEVPTDKNKTITSVVVSYEGAEAADIASVKLSSGKKTEDVSSKITLNGNAIRLGEDHHGFLYMGHIITLPHTFGDDNVCTICGYKRIVIEPTSKLIETEVKINDDTVNKLDKEVTVADGTAACSDDQFSILLPRAYSIGDEVKIHIKGSSDGDFRIWAADGGTTMSPEPLWKASENGFTSGNFDLEITLTIGDKDNSGKETANAVLFKGPSYGVKLSNFKLTYFAYYVEEEGDYKTSSNALYSLTTTGGQNFENKNLAGGLALETNDGRTRLATSWVGEGKVYDAMVNAFKANPEAVIKITYTGTITAFGIESENAGILDVANEVTEGQKYTVMTVKVADVLDTCKDAIADSSWRNIYVVAEDGAVLYGFEVVPA